MDSGILFCIIFVDPGILFCIIIFAFIFFIVILPYFTLKTTENSWSKFVAENPDLMLIKSSFLNVTGQYKGFDYSLYTILKETNYNSRTRTMNVETYTLIDISLPITDNVCHFNIYYNGILCRIGNNILGVKGVVTGDTVFDDAFVLLSETPERIKEIFTPKLRSFLLDRESLINITLYGSKLTYERRGILKNLNDIRSISEAMYHIAKSVCAVNGLEESGEKRILSQTYQCLHCWAEVPLNNKFCMNCGREKQ
jgi:hypothetical protein